MNVDNADRKPRNRLSPSIEVASGPPDASLRVFWRRDAYADSALEFVTLRNGVGRRRFNRSLPQQTRAEGVNRPDKGRFKIGRQLPALPNSSRIARYRTVTSMTAYAGARRDQGLQQYVRVGSPLRRFPEASQRIAANAPAVFLPNLKSAERCFEFFTANIRNRDTRRAYYNAAFRFAEWCEGRGLRDLAAVNAVPVDGHRKLLRWALVRPWRRVNLAEGFIEVTGAASKTRQRRIVRLTHTLPNGSKGKATVYQPAIKWLKRMRIPDAGHVAPPDAPYRLQK